MYGSLGTGVTYSFLEEGQGKTGERVRSTVATKTTRKFTRHTHGAESTRNSPVIVTVETEELVIQHDLYRPHLEGEKDTRKATYWRGARIWRN